MTLHHDPIAGASGWFNDNFLAIGTAPATIGLNLALISTSINGALWSIQVELVMVGVLPAALVLANRLSDRQNLGLAVALCIASAAILLPATFAHPQLRPLGAYMYCFYLGLLVPRALAAPALRPFLGSGVAVLAGLGVAAVCHVLASNGHLQWQNKYVLDAWVALQIVAYVASAPRVAAFLRHRLLVGLGDCSYSFYAYGQLVLASSAFALFRLSPAPWWTQWPITFITCALALALAINIPLAYASYLWIELPFIALGRTLTRRSANAPASSTFADDRAAVAQPTAPAPGHP
jgi:peptidoglycan/LPS O-acetylase OafA/YrhL